MGVADVAFDPGVLVDRVGARIERDETTGTGEGEEVFDGVPGVVDVAVGVMVGYVSAFEVSPRASNSIERATHARRNVSARGEKITRRNCGAG